MPSGWIASRLRRRGSSAKPGPAAPEREPEPAPAPDVMPGPQPEPSPEQEPPTEPGHSEPASSTPRIAAVPPPEPEPQPEAGRQVEPPAAGEVVSIAARSGPPREWNLWELERIAREQAGDDVVRDEERAYLLIYLREFATADGILPVDFDGVVREAFGDVLNAAYS